MGQGRMPKLQHHLMNTTKITMKNKRDKNKARETQEVRWNLEEEWQNIVVQSYKQYERWEDLSMPIKPSWVKGAKLQYEWHYQVFASYKRPKTLSKRRNREQRVAAMDSLQKKRENRSSWGWIRNASKGKVEIGWVLVLKITSRYPKDKDKGNKAPTKRWATSMRTI